MSNETVGLLNPTAERIRFPYNSGPDIVLKAKAVTQVPAEVVGLILRKHTAKGVTTVTEKPAAPAETPPVESAAPEEAPAVPEETKKKARRPGKAKR